MPESANVERIQVVLLNQPVEMDVSEGLAGIRAPETQHAWLDVLDLERLTELGVVLEVQHPEARTPSAAGGWLAFSA